MIEVDASDGTLTQPLLFFLANDLGRTQPWVQFCWLLGIPIPIIILLLLLWH
jgi:hypothetical protein